jgi:hypothetical protein
MPLGFGIYNPMPLQLGGGDSLLEQEHQAILDALEDGFDPEVDTEHYWEAYAEAVAVFMIWRINERLKSQGQPLTMIENLPVWEESTEIRVNPSDKDYDRRSRLNAKLRGVANNAMPDIESAARDILGANFEQVTLVDPADWIVYWPGINPGPPGFEWSSNRAAVAVVMNSNSLSEIEFNEKRVALSNQLDAMLPAWMRYAIGTGTAFVANIGIVGQTLL